MTPTEIKAKQLVEKFSTIEDAIKCVEEIIKLLDIEGYGNDYIIKFWQQVLTHLKEM